MSPTPTPAPVVITVRRAGYPPLSLQGNQTVDCAVVWGLRVFNAIVCKVRSLGTRLVSSLAVLLLLCPLLLAFWVVPLVMVPCASHRARCAVPALRECAAVDPHCCLCNWTSLPQASIGVSGPGINSTTFNSTLFRMKLALVFSIHFECVVLCVECCLSVAGRIVVMAVCDVMCVFVCVFGCVRGM